MSRSITANISIGAGKGKGWPERQLCEKYRHLVWGFRPQRRFFPVHMDDRPHSYGNRTRTLLIPLQEGSAGELHRSLSRPVMAAMSRK